MSVIRTTRFRSDISYEFWYTPPSGSPYRIVGISTSDFKLGNDETGAYYSSLAPLDGKTLCSKDVSEHSDDRHFMVFDDFVSEHLEFVKRFAVILHKPYDKQFFVRGILEVFEGPEEQALLWKLSS